MMAIRLEVGKVYLAHLYEKGASSHDGLEYPIEIIFEFFFEGDRFVVGLKQLMPDPTLDVHGPLTFNTEGVAVEYFFRYKIFAKSRAKPRFQATH